jgi:hypothetical protein
MERYERHLRVELVMSPKLQRIEGDGAERQKTMQGKDQKYTSSTRADLSGRYSINNFTHLSTALSQPDELVMLP